MSDMKIVKMIPEDKRNSFNERRVADTKDDGKGERN